MLQRSALPLKRRYLLGIIALAAALAVAAARFFVTGGAAMKPAGPPEKVTIAYAALPDAALGVVAQMRGYYREEGLEAAPRLHPYGKLALQDVLEGKADFATVAETPIMFAITKAEKIAIIATIQTANQTHAIVARRDRGVHAFSDLRNRKVAVTVGTTSDYFLDAIMAMHGISRKEVTFIDLKAEEVSGALERGDVDAASTFSPYAILAQQKLGDRGIAFYDKNIFTSTFNVVATQVFVRQNPGKIVKMLRALLKAEEFVRKHPAEAQQIVADFIGVDIALVRDSWAGQDFGVTLDQSLLLALEDESKWAIKNRLAGSATKIPNYLDFVYLDGLNAVKPRAVNILR